MSSNAQTGPGFPLTIAGSPKAVARRYVPTPSADAVLRRMKVETAAGASPGMAAARALADHRIDWRPLRAAIVASERAIVLAGRPLGPALAIRAFQPARPTAVHDHGCAGAALVVEGRQRYEQFGSGRPNQATLISERELVVGDVAWWEGPPDDIHRQTALDSAAIELVLLSGPVLESVIYLAMGGQ